MYLLLVSDDRH